MTDLERAILTLVTYYDIFDYPLSLMEVYLWMYSAPLRPSCDSGLRGVSACPPAAGSLRGILKSLDNLGDKIEERDGFYFLKGRRELVRMRQEKRNFGVLKWKKAVKVVKVLRYVPFVRMIALCNNNGFLNTKKESDIDFFVITGAGQIWLTRFLVSLITQIMGVRRQGQKIDDRICLSFYITDEALDVRKFYDKNNMYLYQWMNLVAPIFDVGGIYEKFFCANKWIKEFLPRAGEWLVPESAVIADKKGSRKIREIGEGFLSGRLGRFGGRVLKKFQLRRMMAREDSVILEDDDRVVVNDFVMKFHERELPGYRPDSFVNE